jgi:hypothetical protein
MLCTGGLNSRPGPLYFGDGKLALPIFLAEKQVGFRGFEDFALTPGRYI